MSQHTPWIAKETRIYTGDGRFDIRNLLNAEERAAFIVNAVNSHDALVKALKDIQRRANEGGNGEMALHETVLAMHRVATTALSKANR